MEKLKLLLNSGDPELCIEGLKLWFKHAVPVPKEAEEEENPFEGLSDEELIAAVKGELKSREKARGRKVPKGEQ